MSLIVQKFSGSFLSSFNDFVTVANHIIDTVKNGNKVIVVLSAMKGETDLLIKKAKKITDNPNKKALDILLSTGEQQSVALMSITLASLGYSSETIVGHQIEIFTNNDYGNARIMEVGNKKFSNSLLNNDIVLVSGFQGCDYQGNITTLGRGGSDTTAVVLSATMNADICEIYKDLGGIYTIDPNFSQKTKKIERISYDEMLEILSSGDRTIQYQAVTYAKRYHVTINLKKLNSKDGTLIKNKDKEMDNNDVTSIVFDNDLALIIVKSLQNKPGTAAKLFKHISDENIIVDMIVQNKNEDNKTDVTFSIHKKDYEKALSITQDSLSEIGAESVIGDSEIAKISLIGGGMSVNCGVATRMFDALAKEKINIEMISTSDIRISCIVKAKYAELAVHVLNSKFELA